ncbi:alpha/beta hydrolase [Streptomyces sp. MST-110588]|uniref:alpha/beta fold hydrolase n=1 Tax=Streptomyces sp. MST-110588 TaxID=2833628 RepID=UPI001F5D929A|nr:alpha/beta hydrolase [Streptomyces sp. MST-110588]UNO38509.1 alpha/beta hydrolase [Streptomyces sp. MST-110588]
MSTRVPVPGGELAYTVEGAGQPGVLCHQYRSVSTNGSLARALTPHLRLHAVAPRGMGGSGPVRDERDLTMEGFAGDLSAMREGLGLPPWVAVGSSTGGMVALLHALRDPAAVRGLVLVSTAASRRFTEGSLADPGHPRAGEAAEAMKLAAQDPALSARRLFQLSVADPERNPAPPAEDEAANSQERLASFMRELPAFDLEPELGAIKAPTLVIVGRHDPQCPPANSERLAEAIPSAQLHIFPESGHYPHIEEPERFRAVVEEWFAEAFS